MRQHSEPLRLRAERVETSRGWRYWLDPTCWAQLDEPDPRVASRLRQADGFRPTDTLTEPLEHRQQEALVGLLGLFHGSGLATAGHAATPLARLRIGIVGAGALARHLAQALAQAGVRRFVLLDEGSQKRQLHPVDGALRARLGVRVTTVRSIGQLAEVGVDLVVVAPSTIEADRLQLDLLARLGINHLVVAAHGDVGRLGPLVLPGRTPCVGCSDLATQVRDREWPQVLAQLSRRIAHPNATVMRLLSAQVALEVGWLARSLDDCDRLVGTVEVVDVVSPRPREARFAAQPSCGCTATEPTLVA